MRRPCCRATGVLLLSLALLATLEDQVTCRPASLVHHLLLHQRTGAKRRSLLSNLSWREALESVLQRVGSVSWEIDWEELSDDALPRDAAGGMAAGRASPSNQPMLQLFRCINTKHDPKVAMSWEESVVKQSLGTIKAVGVWWSTHAHHTPLSLVTVASMSRLDQLHAQCRSWPGPLSVVVYQPVLKGNTSGDARAGMQETSRELLRAAVSQVTQFVADMRALRTACQPDVLLVYEMYADEVSLATLFPYNVLRNLARLQARTPLVALVDVDLLVSSSLAKRLSDAKRAQALARKAREGHAVFIIPAFEVHTVDTSRPWPEVLAEGPKSLMVEAYQSKGVTPFNQEAFKRGHMLTEYDRWISAKRDYRVTFIYKSEPWVVGDRLNMPWHDARYRGYGFDKIQHLTHLNASSFTFHVLHDAFAVHRPHKQNEGRAMWNEGKKSQAAGAATLFSHNTELFHAQIKLHDEGQFEPPVTSAVSHCRQLLPWWHGWRSA